MLKFSNKIFHFYEKGIETKCPIATKPHLTECNKYLKCAELSSNIISWITMKCQEGLIYDKNLRSCAIPGKFNKKLFR